MTATRTVAAAATYVRETVNGHIGSGGLCVFAIEGEGEQVEGGAWYAPGSQPQLGANEFAVRVPDGHTRMLRHGDAIHIIQEARARAVLPDIHIAELVTVAGYGDPEVIVHRGPRDPDSAGAIDWDRAEVVGRAPIDAALADNYRVVLGWLNGLGFQPRRQAGTVWEGFEDVAHGSMVEVEPR